MKFVDEYARFLRANENSDKTITDYAAIIGRMEDFISAKYGATMESGDVKGYMVAEWGVSVSPFKPTTRILYIQAAARYLKWLYSMQYLTFDLSVALPKPPSLEKYYKLHPEAAPDKRAYKHEEVKNMLNTETRFKIITLRNRAAMAVLLGTGLRVSELVSLNVGDIMNGEFASVARKGTHGNKVTVAVPENIRPMIVDYLNERKKRGEMINDDSPLLLSRNGGRASRHDIYRTLANVEKQNNVPTGVHTFRHTALTTTAKLADPVVARDLAGQKSVSITNRYLHTENEELLTAARRLAGSFLE